MDASRRSIVYLVDDDDGVRLAVRRLLEAQPLRVIDFPSAEAFLAEADLTVGSAHCLLLDIGLPGMDGVSLQQELARRGIELPILVLTGLVDVSKAVRALKAGAIDVLQKPVGDELLSTTVLNALRRDVESRALIAERLDVQRRLSMLSRRERHIMDELVSGKMIKELSASLGIGTQTILKHRARMLKKIGVRNDVELVGLLSAHGLTPSNARRTALASASLEKGLQRMPDSSELQVESPSS